MNDSLVIRRVTEDDLGYLRQFHRECFGRELSEERWSWFHQQAPTGAVRAYVAEAEHRDRRRIVATYGFLPIRLRLNHREISASLAVGAAVHPDCRKRGLFVQMGEYVLQKEAECGTAVTLGKPNKSALAGHLKIGWRILCSLPKLCRKSPREQPHACQLVPRFDDRFGRFFDKAIGKYSLAVVKDAGFMNWRLSAPQQQYARYVYEREGRILGFIVLKHYRGPKGSVTHIVDLQAADDAALEQLLAAGKTFAAGTREINLWSNPYNPYAARLRELGFEPRDDGDLLIVHTNCGEPELPEPGSWWFSYADNDIY